MEPRRRIDMPNWKLRIIMDKAKSFGHLNWLLGQARKHV